MDATKIGTFIAAERRAKGWTQRQLAGELQLTDKAVSRWETGKGLPDVSLLLPLAAALGVSVGELLAGQRQRVKFARRVANPGCHATGFIAAVYPLIRLGIIGTDYPLTAHSLTGYSGGGKAMIAEYEAENRSPLFDSPRQYGLGQQHKHLPEMQYVTGIDTPPVFCPIVVDYYSGMATCIPLIASLFKKKVTKDELLALLTEYYKDAKLISVGTEETNFLASNPLSDTNELKLYVEGNDERMTLISVFDNLGKGASGAAVENMNLVLGLDETTGLL